MAVFLTGEIVLAFAKWISLVYNIYGGLQFRLSYT